MPARLVFVGGGPKTTGLLLALAAAAEADRSAFPERLEIIVVDPYGAGGGRIWRHDQSPTLWMNSLAEDVTIFADPGTLSVTRSNGFQHTVSPLTGPSLSEWAATRDLTALGAPRDGLTGADFAPRRIQAEYLAWAFDQARERLPEGFSLEAVRGRVIAAEPMGDAHIVSFEDLSAASAADEHCSVIADVLVLAQGFLEVSDDEETARLRRQAAARGLGYIAPGYTADVDLSVLPAGEDVLVRGLGLAFIDAMMMVTEDRGGRFERRPGDPLAPVVYHPSGQEPVLWAGSGRGIAYKSKLGYRPEGMAFGPPRWVTEDALLGLRGANGTVDCERVLFPLLEAELATAHYVELATRHEGRTQASADAFVEQFAAWHAAFLRGDTEGADALRAAWQRFAKEHVPDPADRFDLAHLDRPFEGTAFSSHAGFEQAAAAHVRAEIDRAADARYSQDSAVFFALVSVYFVTRNLVAAGLFEAEDRIRSVDGRLFNLFSYIASGPPPERLENLLALHRAGIVRFLGAGVHVRVDGDAFVGGSAVHPDEVRAQWLLDARLATVSAARAKDPLLQSLLADGHLRLEGALGSAAKLVTDAHGHALRQDGSAAPGMLLVGPSVAGSTAEAFSRPGIGARVFADNAQLVETLRQELEGPVQGKAVATAARTASPGR